MMRGSRHRDQLKAYPDTVGGHDDEVAQFMGVAGQDCGQAGENEVCGWTRAQPKQDHAGMRLMVDEDQSPEMTVMRDEDAAFLFGNGEDFSIGQTRGVVYRDRGDIMAHLPQEGDDAEIRAFVQQKPHALAGTRSARFLAAASASFRCGDWR